MSAGKWHLATVLGPLLLLCLTASKLSAAHEPKIANSSASHRHAVVEINLRPIISRLRVSLIRPRRLLFGPEGDLFVADWGAGTVLRVSPDGKVSVVAHGLNEPAGLARDGAGNLYVSTHAGGMMKAGTVVKISKTGEQSLFAEGLWGPTGLAFDADGNLFVANFHGNNIARISLDGETSIFADEIPAPAAVVFDPSGQLFTISSTEGTLLGISENGNVTVVARGLGGPSDLAVDSWGHLIVANYGSSGLSYVDEQGHVSTFALVPKGTIGMAFDPDDNLLLVNWDYHYLLRVVTNLTIPCPHCGKKIPVRLRLRRKSQGTRLSKKRAPII